MTNDKSKKKRKETFGDGIINNDGAFNVYGRNDYGFGGDNCRL